MRGGAGSWQDGLEREYPAILMSTETDIDELVDGIYTAMAEPLRYDDFMACWEDFVQRCIDEGQAETLASRVQGALDSHLACAMEIMERLGRRRQDALTVQQVADSAPGIGVVVDAGGLILASNLQAADLTRGRSQLAELGLDDDVFGRVDRWLRSPEGNFLFSTCQLDDGQNGCLLVARVELPARSVDSAGAAASRCYLLSLVDLRLGGEATSALAEVFGLSDAEAEVAVLLSNGDSPAQIAERRGASINTVRTQIKRLLKKTRANGIPDMVRILCGFAATHAHLQRHNRRALSATPLRRETTITLPDGRALGFVDQGDAHGQPVLFVHGMLYGPYWTDHALEVCARQGWRIIAPFRAGFGRTDAFDPPRADIGLVDAVVQDLVWLLAHLHIDSALIVGHAAGSVYAHRLAARHPALADGLLMVSHAPYWHDRLLAELPMRQRLVARTSRFAPGMLPFLTRSGVALIDAGREDRFIDALHRDNPEDMRALRRPDVWNAVVEGLRQTVRQGPQAFCLDCPVLLTDWSDDAQRITAPVHILHGLADRVVTPSTIEPYLARHAPAEVSWVDGAGQFLLYSHWPRVLDALRRIDASG
jgi:pimeloyl-ACP methyl ester carboxylesterase/DNA-binding CsgD family transcriptional regulator